MRGFVCKHARGYGYHINMKLAAQDSLFLTRPLASVAVYCVCALDTPEQTAARCSVSTHIGARLWLPTKLPTLLKMRLN